MREDLLKILTAEIETQVERLFENERMRAVAAGKKFATVPYLDDLFAVEYTSLFPHIKRQVCAALAARECFRGIAPPWAPGLLPLSSTDIGKLVHSKNNRFVLVGHFAASLAASNWNIKTHPTFQVYAAGVMACPYTPSRIRNDPELLKEFPPRPLEGLDRSLCWNVYERIFEFTQQLMKNEEHWRRCGMADDARWARSVIEEITQVGLDQELRNFLDSQT